MKDFRKLRVVIKNNFINKKHFYIYSTVNNITLFYFLETTAMNPQFHIQIPRMSGNKCHVVVSITQFYETNVIEIKRRRTLYAIGFAVYEVPHSMQKLTTHFITEHVS